MTYEPVRGSSKWAEIGLTNRWAGEKITEAKAVEGTTTLVTCEAEKQIVLFWVGLVSSQENTGEVLATVKLAPYTPYEWYLGNPGIFAHWEPVKGEVGANLVLELSGTQKVAVNYTYVQQFPTVS